MQITSRTDRDIGEVPVLAVWDGQTLDLPYVGDLGIDRVASWQRVRLVPGPPGPRAETRRSRTTAEEATVDIYERITNLEREQAGRRLLNLGQFRQHCPEEAWPYEALRQSVREIPGAATVIENVMRERGLWPS